MIRKQPADNENSAVRKQEDIREYAIGGRQERQVCGLDGQLVVIQTMSGKEELLNTYLERMENVSRLVVETFFPKRQVRKRFHGQWNTVTEKIFPGYLFLDTTDAQALYVELKRVPMLSKILGDREASFVTLAPQEETFIRRIGRDRGDHSIGLSQVRIESDAPYKKGDRVTVLSGDLKDFEGEIIGYDFRKRKAMIKTDLFGGTVIHVGIELLGDAR